jgi:glycosyltransferase involved in cell wall biosynthesis
MPSVSEPFGIAALEAALANTPVIVSKNSGVIEVLPHAYPIDFWDVDEMSKTILELITKPEVRQHQANEVQQEAQSLEWTKMAKRVQSIYHDLLS